MNIREFLDKVEQVALNSMEIVEDHVDVAKERWAEFQEDIKSVPSLRECLATKTIKINHIKNQSKGRRHKSQKQLRR